jgi:uncharacterized protein
MDFGGMTAAVWRLPGYQGGEPGQPVPADVVGVMLPQVGDRGPDDPPPSWSVDFWVPDPDATAARVRTLGASVLVLPFDTPSAAPASSPTPRAPPSPSARPHAGSAGLAFGRGP